MKIKPILIILLFICSKGFSQKKSKKISPQVPIIVKTEATTAFDRWKANKARLELNEISLAKNIKFRSVGPSVMSGRVADIDVNEENPTEFFVAYGFGGLWHTKNNGQTFTPIFDNQAVITIGDIAVNWKSKNKTIWVGTGESSSSRSTYAGLGLFKSDDNGKTWLHKGLDESHHIGRIKLHPTEENTLWVAAVGRLYTPNAERGIFKSSDGGNTWKNTLFVNENTGAIDLQIDPKNPNILYAAFWEKDRKAWNFEEGGATSGIYKSTDGGENWALLTVKESGFPQGKTNGRIGLAISQNNPNLIYAVLDNQAKQINYKSKENAKLSSDKLKSLSKEQFLSLSNEEINEYLDENNFPEKNNAKDLKTAIRSNKIEVADIAKFTENANDDLFKTPISGAEVYKSNDAGKSWARTHQNYLDAVFNTYGYYFGTIHVAPSNDEKIVIPGYQIVQSIDGGKSFQSMNAPNVHADHHSLWINPKNENHLILGNDGGINISYDNGKNWSFANTAALGTFYAIQVDMATPYNVYGGLQDNGVWVGPSTYTANSEWQSDGHYPYKQLLGGDGMQIEVDTRDNNTLYTGFQFGNYFRINKATGHRKYLQMPQEIGGLKNRFNWQTPIFLSAHNQDFVYLGGNKLFRSTNKGDNWEAISQDLTKGGKTGDVPYGTITSLSESPIRLGLIYVGTDDGNVQISKDGGYTFTKIAEKLPQNLWVSRIIASKFSESRVYVSLSGYRNDDFSTYLYKSEDYGANWTKIGTNLPNEPINVIREDPKNAELIYIGNDHGVYVSLNQGKSFMPMTNGLPTVPVHDLLVHPRDNELVIGTHGRSIYIANVEHLQQIAESDSIAKMDLHLFALKPITYSENWGKIDGDEKYSPTKKQEYSIPFYSKNSGKAKIKILSNARFILNQLDVAMDAGVNYFNWDLAIDSSVMFDYGMQLNSQRKNTTPKIELEKADDGKVYIRPGKYIISIETGEGKKVEKALEVKALEKVSKRAN
ncbi:MAG: glycosyl hydrolase [Bacteroidota bacterium]